jgi:hypothetical protein
MIRLALLLAIVLVTGCGPPQVEPANYRLIESLRTALSVRNGNWLEDNAKLIAKKHADGQISETEFTAFETIIGKAQRAGGALPPPKNDNPAPQR